jgi:hypothetical protein
MRSRSRRNGRPPASTTGWNSCSSRGWLLPLERQPPGPRGRSFKDPSQYPPSGLVTNYASSGLWDAANPENMFDSVHRSDAFRVVGCRVRTEPSASPPPTTAFTRPRARSCKCWRNRRRPCALRLARPRPPDEVDQRQPERAAQRRPGRPPARPAQAQPFGSAALAPPSRKLAGPGTERESRASGATAPGNRRPSLRRDLHFEAASPIALPSSASPFSLSQSDRFNRWAHPIVRRASPPKNRQRLRSSDELTELIGDPCWGCGMGD